MNFDFDAWWKEMKPAECDELKPYFEESWQLGFKDGYEKGHEMQNELTVGRIEFAPDAAGTTDWYGQWKAQAGDAERLREENRKLRDFARAVMECWPMGDLDGDTLQDAAVAHGLLKPETRHEPCGEGCNCAQYAEASEFESGVVCYRKTPLLKGPNAK